MCRIEILSLSGKEKTYEMILNVCEVWNAQRIKPLISAAIGLSNAKKETWSFTFCTTCLLQRWTAVYQSELHSVPYHKWWKRKNSYSTMMHSLHDDIIVTAVFVPEDKDTEEFKVYFYFHLFWTNTWLWKLYFLIFSLLKVNILWIKKKRLVSSADFLSSEEELCCLN